MIDTRIIEDAIITALRDANFVGVTPTNVIASWRNVDASKRTLESGGILVRYDGSSASNFGVNGVAIRRELRFGVYIGVRPSSLVTINELVEGVRDVIVERVRFEYGGRTYGLTFRSDNADGESNGTIWFAINFTTTLPYTHG